MGWKSNSPPTPLEPPCVGVAPCARVCTSGGVVVPGSRGEHHVQGAQAQGAPGPPSPGPSGAHGRWCAPGGSEPRGRGAPDTGAPGPPTPGARALHTHHWHKRPAAGVSNLRGCHQGGARPCGVGWCRWGGSRAPLPRVPQGCHPTPSPLPHKCGGEIVGAPPPLQSMWSAK